MDHRSAAAPLIAGAAIEVPDIRMYPPLALSERIPTPGAVTSTSELVLEKSARLPCWSEAATETTSGYAAGHETADSPPLPADATTRTPADETAFTAACRALDSGPPRERLIISVRPLRQPK